MCGIAGFSWPDDTLIRRMSDVLWHRGPDDEGTFVDSDVSLGHRRLSILDLSELGRQPMAYADRGRTIVVVFNGEIYNFRQVRRELEGKGYRFRTGTDTEVIPGAYLEWGLECVRRFSGMWAFALYDSASKQIVLSRDRFGEKPIYYRLQDGKLIFASEIKAILEHPISRRANRATIADYLFRGIANQGRDSFFEDIQMLPPACSGVFDVKTGRLTLHKYYEISYGNRKIGPDEFRGALKQSVCSRLIADVPISVSLSSGIDSTSVAALASGCTEGVLRAFTTASDQALGDESGLIRHFLDRYPRFDLAKSQLSEASFCDHYREIIFHMDEPFARQSAYVRWEIANLTGKHGFKVLLNGEGADEILGGYLAFVPHYVRYLARKLKLIRLVQEVYGALRHPERRRILDAFVAGRPLWTRLAGRQEATTGDRVAKFGIRLEPNDRPSPRGKDLKHYLATLVCESSLPRLLNCNDKMTMANSVEARAPFLDHEFVDLAFSMDMSDLVVDGRRKTPLRQAMRGHLPDEILMRKDKDAFNAPIFEYLRNEAIKRRIREIFADARTSCLFSSKAYLAEYDRFLARQGTDRQFLLHGLLLEEWSRIFRVTFNA